MYAMNLCWLDALHKSLAFVHFGLAKCLNTVSRNECGVYTLECLWNPILARKIPTGGQIEMYVGMRVTDQDRMCLRDLKLKTK